MSSASANALGGGATDRRRAPCASIALTLLLCAIDIDPVLALDLAGLPLTQALQVLEERGLMLLYSSDLVQPWMRVQEDPDVEDPRRALESIVQPFAITVVDGPNGSLMLVRARPSTPPGEVAEEPSNVRTAVAPTELEEVVVSASHYRLAREPSAASISMSATDMQLLPDFADDPLRTAARLPGIASSQFSSKSNVRGGEADETLVRFDGLRLHNPFHLKDFQNVFSAIDPAIVSAMQIYTGAFPVTYGDRLSSVIDIAPRLPAKDSHGELALSFFNASGLVAGTFDESQGDWLLSVRRGNLDLLLDVVNPAIGAPSYLDFHGRLGKRLSSSLEISANALVFDDAIVLFDSDREEEARAEYRDRYLWMRFAYRPSPAVAAEVLLAHTRLASTRRGRADQEGISRGSLDDRRDFWIESLQSDWSWRLSEQLLLQFGGEWQHMRGRYAYRDEVEFDLLFLTPGAWHEPYREREVAANPSGDRIGAYVNVRLDPLPNFAADAGVRWDQEQLSPQQDHAVSPRLNLLYSLSERVRVRAGWGRFFQSQTISELQVSDGIAEFLPPQRADHWVASIEYDHPRGAALRLEAYRKDYRRLRPRFENLLNAFVLLPELKPDRVRIAPDRATAKGLELTLRATPGRPFDWWLSYTWSSVEDHVGAVHRARSWDQRHYASGGIVWQNERWELSIAGSYHTGWPTTELELADTDPIPTVATTANARLGSFYSVDLRAARHFDLAGASRLTAFIELTNLLNRTNDCCVEYEIEDEDETGIDLDLQTRTFLPLTPSLGIVWRF